MHKEINSIQNATIKRVLQLKEKSRIRKKEGLFIIEGQRELALAIAGKYSVKTIFFTPEILSLDTLNHFIKEQKINPEVIKIPLALYQKIAYRGTTEGIIALVEAKNTAIKTINLNVENPLILVAEAPEKPGNIGAILRTADAAGVDLVCIANPRTDLYNPNIVRSSVGCLFTTNLATGTTTEIISFLKENNINIYAATLQAAVPYQTIDFKKPTAIIVGTEATGLSEDWRSESTDNILIPMSGKIDSLNVSVAAGILIFEAKRQRGFHLNTQN